MTSINTNTGAMTALQTLRQTEKGLAEAQDRIATGLRVASAEDNAAYWSIATSMRSDHKALSAVQDALGLGAATVDVAYTAVHSAVEIATELKAKLVAAREPGVDRLKIQSEIVELQGQLRGIADSASFGGENWLSVPTGVVDPATKSIVASFNRVDGAIDIGTITVDISTMKLFDADDADGILDKTRTGLASSATFAISSIDISALTDSVADLAILEDYLQGVDDSISEMTVAATVLGSSKSRINLQKDFVSSLMSAIERGVAALVDADMNEESTRLQALQVKQQLAVQALSIANASSQNILSLFRS